MSLKDVKAVHRFWGGPEMPQEYADYAQRWLDLHPDWLVVEWALEDVLNKASADVKAIVDDLYERDAGRNGIELYVQIADVLGYWLVYKFGGVYVNCDIEPLKNIEKILPNKAWASYENNEDGRVVNAIIGAPEPHDPFWAKVLLGLKENYFKYRTDEMVMATGPGYLTKVAEQYPDEIHVFPVETFNPVHWKQIAAGGDAKGFEYPDKSYGVHHWGHKRDGRSNTVETATQPKEA